MTDSKNPILVFGATGQQGGSVVTALLQAGWPVRALVRDPASAKAAALRAAGATLLRGGFDDTAAMRAAMQGAHAVFSVQPSSPGGAITDADEIRYGIAVADLAAETGIRHLIYSSGSAVRDAPTGMAHFDTKSRIEAHIRALPIAATIVRPATFMELLVMPGFGLDQGRFTFFNHRDQPMQFLAVEDIGRFVAAILADPARFAGHTLELAGDSLTGAEMEAAFTAAAGRPIRHQRFPDDVLRANPFLAKLTALVDQGPLAGHADLAALRRLNPRMRSFQAWLAGPGRAAFQQALGTAGAWTCNDR